MTTNYISSLQDYDSDEIVVWERPVGGGRREMKRYAVPRYFYVPDENGEHTTTTGELVTKLSFSTQEEFDAAKKQHRVRFESDFSPEARLLMDEFKDRPVPIVHHAFLDIEVDYDSARGWSSPDNPYAPINAITIYQSWTEQYLTYAVPPRGWKDDGTFQAKILAMCQEHKLNFVPEITLCKNEKDLLLYMLEDIQDADIISGWNSEFFDNPYIIKRLERVLGASAPKHMCFTVLARDSEKDRTRQPKARTVKRFGAEALTYSLHGRTHLDYLDLFKKFTFEGRVSYSLANIAAEELDVPKLDYPGTLEQLYNNDFVLFSCYNMRDVEILVNLDNKFKFMRLVNQMAHENTVPFSAILGTVRYVETGMTNFAHTKLNRIVNDKVISTEQNAKVEGAIVMVPLAGLHKKSGSVDITSLYPSVGRALNMSIETFVGQFKEEEDAWLGVCAQNAVEYTLDLVTNETLAMTGAAWHALFRERNLAVSAFGTVFDQNKPGVFAATLTFWFEERKRLQAEKKKYAKLLKTETDPTKKLEYSQLVEDFDLLQLTKKIQLNSAYGALLNEAFRFGRRELGASITGTGRQIEKHMIETIAYLLSGKKAILVKRYAAGDYDEHGVKYDAKDKRKNPNKRFGKNAGRKVTDVYAEALADGNMQFLLGLPKRPEYDFKKNPETGEKGLVPTSAVYWAMFEDETVCRSIIYGDTDSSYFATGGTDYEEAVAIADQIAVEVNTSFPEFMSSKFNCTDGRDLLIKAAREIVTETGLFMRAKKKYTLRVVNLDGADLRESPKLKTMGSEIKKADTPKAIQEFLKELMELVLNGAGYKDLAAFVNLARGKLINRDSNILELAPAKQINNLDALYAEYKRTEKFGIKMTSHCPGHVRAAINYNELLLQYDDVGRDKPLKAGDKGVIMYLEENHHGIKSIAFPSDMMRLPEWFTEHFKVDLDITEQKMIDSKTDGIFEALGYETPTPQNAFLKSVFSF